MTANRKITLPRILAYGVYLKRKTSKGASKVSAVLYEKHENAPQSVKNMEACLSKKYKLVVDKYENLPEPVKYKVYKIKKAATAGFCIWQHTNDWGIWGFLYIGKYISERLGHDKTARTCEWGLKGLRKIHELTYNTLGQKELGKKMMNPKLLINEAKEKISTSWENFKAEI